MKSKNGRLLWYVWSYGSWEVVLVRWGVWFSRSAGKWHVQAPWATQMLLICCQSQWVGYQLLHQLTLGSKVCLWLLICSAILPEPHVERRLLTCHMVTVSIPHFEAEQQTSRRAVPIVFREIVFFSVPQEGALLLAIPSLALLVTKGFGTPPLCCKQCNQTKKGEITHPSEAAFLC